MKLPSVLALVEHSNRKEETEQCTNVQIHGQPLSHNTNAQLTTGIQIPIS